MLYFFPVEINTSMNGFLSHHKHTCTE